MSRASVDKEPSGVGEGEEFHKELPQEEEQEPEEVSVLTVYDPDDFFSGAVVTEDASLPENLFEFKHSYGYDSHKHFNVCACDEAVVVWTAGCILVFLDVDTGRSWFRRSTTGGAIGHVCSHRLEPNYRLAVAECREGDREPIIIVYTWPLMGIDAVLREGTTNAYSVMDFSPDGELLASVGREPDYNLTIWDWKMHKILLRTSAFTFDVFNVLFSPFCPGQLTTSGAAHIKFWKMAETFTGLKLKGELGRFGKTEICDVIGVFPMPDEKVLSGCEWGNILVWEAGLVKLEVTMRGRKRCHGAPIVQFLRNQDGDEMTTVAMDGCVRAWYWDTVEQADPPDDDRYVELNPVAELCIPDASIMCIRHQEGKFWYVQDGNGGIWCAELDLDKEESQLRHRKVVTSHAGGIVALAAMRHHELLASLGRDGALLVYNTASASLVLRYKFPERATSMLYPPHQINPSANLLVIGFEDGALRIMHLHCENLAGHSRGLVNFSVEQFVNSRRETHDVMELVHLVSFLKPHTAALSQISVNPQLSLLVTISADKTLFMYAINAQQTPFQLERLGFIEIPLPVVFFTWKPHEERVILMTGEAGNMIEMELPIVEQKPYEKITTFQQECVKMRTLTLAKYMLRNKPFPLEEDLASLDEEALKKAAEGDNDSDEEEEWVGEIQLVTSDETPTTITWARYNDDDSIWCVQQGTGALLQVRFDALDMLKYAPIPDAWHDTISCVKFVCQEKYLMVGTHNGYIRVLRMPTYEEDNPTLYDIRFQVDSMRLSKKLKGRRLAKPEVQPTPRIDFKDCYYLPMHDRYTGAIICFEFTMDGGYMFSAGADGNIFSYEVNFDQPLIDVGFEEPEEPPEEMQAAPEVLATEEAIPSHEQLKRKEEYDKMMAIANAHKKRVREQLADLTSDYLKLIKANRQLPYSQQIDVVLDERPLIDLENELADALALTRRKLAHQLEASDLGLHKMMLRNIYALDVFPFVLFGIRDTRLDISPIRHKKLPFDFYDSLNEVYEKMAEAALKGKELLFDIPQLKRSESMGPRKTMKMASFAKPTVASFLLGLPPNPPHPLVKALRNYYVRLYRHHEQQIEWQEHLSRKPDPNAMPPGAANALREAEMTIGDHKLKTQEDYIAPHGHNTQLKLCNTRKEIFEIKHQFNSKVVELKETKVKIAERMAEIGRKLDEIRMEVPATMVKPHPPVPTIQLDLEFPEKNLEVIPELKPKTSKAKKKSLAGVQALTGLPRVRQERVPKFYQFSDTHPFAALWEILKPKPDQVSSPMEIDLRERRIQRRLYEQDMLLVEADLTTRQFDSRMASLQREKIRVQERAQVLELHLQQLHREMIVLNRFEAQEDFLAERVYNKLMQVKAVQSQVEECERRIEEHQADAEQMAAACVDLQAQFRRLVHDYKFADFLRRIFKKKYRPPREHDDDESSETESSSSSEEEDEGVDSQDSRDIGPIRLDPNVCPEGCDPDIYNETYALRNARHKHEQDILERGHLVDLLRKDIDAHNRVARKLTDQLEKRQRVLRDFMCEKQACLNEVEVTVVLRYDQIRARAMQALETHGGIMDTLVFPDSMLGRLRDRVLELQQEIADQKKRDKINRTHLHRMNVDLKFMAQREAELRANMRTVLTQKLGKVRRVDRTLDELLRQLARRFKFQATNTVVQEMEAKIREVRRRHGKLEQQYIVALRQQSDKLRVVCALQADYNERSGKVREQTYVSNYSEDQYRLDVAKLKMLRKQQEEHIQTLKEEMTWMKTHGAMAAPTPRQVPRPYVRKAPMKEFHQGPPQKPPLTKYFPIEAGTRRVVRHAWRCCDALNLPRERAGALLTRFTDLLAPVLAGTSTRFEAVEAIVKEMFEEAPPEAPGSGEGQPPPVPSVASEAPQRRAYDTLNTLADNLLKQHLKYLEGGTQYMQGSPEQLELEELRLQVARAGRLARCPPNALLPRLAAALAAALTLLPASLIDTEDGMAALTSAFMDSLLEPFSLADYRAVDIDRLVEDVGDLYSGKWRSAAGEVRAVAEGALWALQAQFDTDDQRRDDIREEEASKMAAEELCSTIVSETPSHVINSLFLYKDPDIQDSDSQSDT